MILTTLEKRCKCRSLKMCQYLKNFEDQHFGLQCKVSTHSPRGSCSRCLYRPNGFPKVILMKAESVKLWVVESEVVYQLCWRTRCSSVFLMVLCGAAWAPREDLLQKVLLYV